MSTIPYVIEQTSRGERSYDTSTCHSWKRNSGTGNRTLRKFFLFLDHILTFGFYNESRI